MDVDVVVLGLGPAGRTSRRKLAEAGLDVVGVDERLVGGECPYYGCVPSKMMIRAADLLAEARRVAESRPAPVDGHARTGRRSPPRIRDEATDDWDDTVAVERLEDEGGTLRPRPGRLVGAGQVVVAGERRIRGRARRRAQHRHRAAAYRRSTGWRTRRTGPTATPYR